MREIFGGAMRPLMERPGSVLMWGAVFSIGAALVTLFNLYVLVPLLFPAERESGLAAAISFDLIRRLLSMLVFALAGTAVFRATIWREDNRWFSLRIGADEGRVFLLMMLLALLQFAGGIILGLLHLFVTSLMSFLSWGNTAALTILTAGPNLAVFALLIWVSVRLSPALPLAVVRRRISIDGAWELSRGRFWPLFGGYLLTGLFSLAVAAVILALFFGDLFIQIFGAGGDPVFVRYATKNFAYRQLSAPIPIPIGEGFAIWLADDSLPPQHGSHSSRDPQTADRARRTGGQRALLKYRGCLHSGGFAGAGGCRPARLLRNGDFLTHPFRSNAAFPEQKMNSRI